ncbi:MAG TPA: hypothetical protein VFQ82_01755 [Stellaceae bacterium]|nr:hypothetical protein [Stellaceae bacterium]
MIIRELAMQVEGGSTIHSAVVVWEEENLPEQVLTFAIGDHGDPGAGPRIVEPCADAFLAACFPLAAVHGEARLKIQGRACPMLVEGLRTVYAWWRSWGGMPERGPEIETRGPARYPASAAPRHAVACLSGGVDGLHLLMRNHRLYRPGDPAYIRTALFIHGFDIGKRARDPENERYRMALQRLEPIAAETGLRLISCRTNLRHLSRQPDFWEYRQHGGALAAVGHAAICGPAYLFIGGTYPLSSPVPNGSHPAVDGLFSSQRLTVVHEGSRFSRLDKVRDLAGWPTALAMLRVCSANPTDAANCGVCEKCLRTRLELLAAGIDETVALGPSLPAEALWARAAPKPACGRAAVYEELLPVLRARGYDALCRVIEANIAAQRNEVEPAFGRVGRDAARYWLDDSSKSPQYPDGRSNKLIGAGAR